MLNAFYNTNALFQDMIYTQNDLGGNDISYANVFSQACYLAHLTNSNEEVFNGTEMVMSTDELTLAYNTNVASVTTNMRVTVDNQNYDILGVFNTFKKHHAIIKLRFVGNNPEEL